MARGDATRMRIENEAIRLFAERGVDATSVRDIAAAAQVAEGALYRHFRSKDDLVRRLFMSRYTALAGDILAIARSGRPFAAQVHELVARFTHLFQVDRALFTFLLINQHRHLAEVPDAPEDNAVEALRLLLAGAMARGEIAEANDEWLTALVIGGLVQPAIFTLYGRLDEAMDERSAALGAAILRLAQHTQAGCPTR